MFQTFQTEASRERWNVRFALIAVVISLGALIVTVLLWRSSERAVKVAENANALIDRSVKAAEETAKTAAQQLELGDRSWVMVTEVKPHETDSFSSSLAFHHTINNVDIDEQAAGPQYKKVTFFSEIHLKVIGHSPALNIDVQTELYLLPKGMLSAEKIAAEETMVCDEFAKEKSELKNAGTPAFPDETPIVYRAATAFASESGACQRP
jgi:hypothetical protein